jgi:hypothetical protein
MQQRAQRGCGFIALFFLNLCARSGWVVNAMPHLCYSLGKNAGTHFRGGCVGPEACLDRCGEGKILVPTGVRTPYHPGHSELINRPRYRGCYRVINQ